MSKTKHQNHKNKNDVSKRQSKIIKRKEITDVKSIFPNIPLKLGDSRWDIFYGKDYQIKSAKLKYEHPFILIEFRTIDDNPMNDEIIGLSVTKSSGRSGVNYIPIPNIIDMKGSDSYVEKDIRYRNMAKKGTPLQRKSLLKKVNKRKLTIKEIR